MTFCRASDAVRNGLRGRKQLYKCKGCGRRFVGGERRDKSQVITDYIEGKQTVVQLAPSTASAREPSAATWRACGMSRKYPSTNKWSSRWTPRTEEVTLVWWSSKMLFESGSMAQICNARDDILLYGGRPMVERVRLQDIRCGDWRNSWSGAGVAPSWLDTAHNFV